VYSNSENEEKALHAFKRGVEWRMAFVTASKLKYSAQQLQALAYELVETLKNTSRYAEAAEILLHYCHDVDEAIAVLLHGNLWLPALQKVTSYVSVTSLSNG
jgi:elongator complex protein 1